MDDATSRTRLFLGQLTRQPDHLANQLSKQSVTLYLQDPTPAGEIAATIATILLLRMDAAAPSIRLVAAGGRTVSIPRLGDGPLADAIAHEHAGFSSLERFDTTSPGGTSLEVSFDARSPGLPVGTSSWDLAIGLKAERETTGNPIVAAIAGALAANEVLKNLLLASGVPLERTPRAWDGCVSIWDYSLGPMSRGPEIREPVELDQVGFVGCGGISGACFWALGLLELAGAPLLVDDDVVDVTNLNRLLFANHESVGSNKVALAKMLLDARGTSAIALAERWNKVDSIIRQGASTILISVDDDSVRRDVQGDLPELIFNGGTSDSGEYQVSRHNFIDAACLACVSHGDKRPQSLEEATALHLGIPLDALLEHIHSRDPLPPELIETASGGNEMKEELRNLPARRITQRFCNDLAVAESTAVSAPTLSALPGLLLAAELVKDKLWSTELGEHNLLRGSVLRGPHSRWLLSLQKRSGCICQDSLYQEHYHRRHTHN